MVFRALFGKPAPARGPSGYRAYAIGDVHGRLDLLQALVRQIRADIDARPAATNLLVLLGDLIDRGPDSRAVIEYAQELARSDLRTIGLMGNHEEILLRIVDGESELIRGWLRLGGSEAMTSYGVDAAELKSLSPTDAQRRIAAAIPAEHIRFLRQLGDTFRFGDYLFVHAGIRPGIPLEQQAQADLRWIRGPFLSDRRAHGFTVVHGHTIVPEVEVMTNRIGIDTGAYSSGILSAVAIEEGDRWFLAAGERERVDG